MSVCQQTLGIHSNIRRALAAAAAVSIATLLEHVFSVIPCPSVISPSCVPWSNLASAFCCDVYVRFNPAIYLARDATFCHCQTMMCRMVKQESLADAKVSARERCVMFARY